MRSIQFTLLPAPDLLQKEVECFRIAHYSGEEGFALTVSPSGMPGIVFQQNNGQSRGSSSNGPKNNDKKLQRLLEPIERATFVWITRSLSGEARLPRFSSSRLQNQWNVYQSSLSLFLGPLLLDPQFPLSQNSAV